MSPALIPSLNAGIHGAVVPIAKFVAPVGDGGYDLAFTSIPQGYQDLMLVWNTRNTAGAMIGFPYIRLNDDGSALYSDTNLAGDGASATSGRNTGTTLARIGIEPSGYSAPNIFGSIVTHILNYANTSTYKTVLSRSSADLNGTGQTRLLVSLYRSTNAISSIRVSDEIGGNFVAGSTITLYGVRSIGQ